MNVTELSLDCQWFCIQLKELEIDFLTLSRGSLFQTYWTGSGAV